MHIGRYVIYAFRGRIQNWSATILLKLHYRFILFFVSFFSDKGKPFHFMLCNLRTVTMGKRKEKTEAEFVEEHKREY